MGERHMGKIKTSDDPDLRRLAAENNVNAQIALVVLRARERAGLTRKELAERVGTSVPSIARFESGLSGRQSLSMLERIATALGSPRRRAPRPSEGARPPDVTRQAAARRAAATGRRCVPPRHGQRNRGYCSSFAKAISVCSQRSSAIRPG
jgi:transcriptional regulator with XRE-family HTH domain